MKNWVLGDPNCPHAKILSSSNSIMPYECSDCGYGMTRQDYDAATGGLRVDRQRHRH